MKCTRGIIKQLKLRAAVSPRARARAARGRRTRNTMRDVYVGLRGNFIWPFFYRRIFIYDMHLNTRIRVRMRDT